MRQALLRGTTTPVAHSCVDVDGSDAVAVTVAQILVHALGKVSIGLGNIILDVAQNIELEDGPQTKATKTDDPERGDGLRNGFGQRLPVEAQADEELRDDD